MKRLLWIAAAAVAVLVLGFGLYRASRPTVVPLSADQAQARLQDMAARFSAAIENHRDVEPLVGEVRPIVEQHPDLADGRKLLGQVYAQLDRIDDAYTQFDAALRLEPDNAQLHNLTGTAAAMLGRTDAAEAHHRRAVELMPGDAALKVPLADLLLKRGRLQEAEALLLAALGQRYSLADANGLLSDVYFARSQAHRSATPPDEEAALADLRQAITQMETALAKASIKPDQAVHQRAALTRKLARLYAALGEPAESVLVLDALPDEARFSKEVLAEMAGYFAQQGRAALAGLQYALAAERSPRDADLLAEAAYWYHRGGDPAAATLMLDRLEALAPHHPRLPELRAAAAASPGRPDPWPAPP